MANELLMAIEELLDRKLDEKLDQSKRSIVGI